MGQLLGVRPLGLLRPCGRPHLCIMGQLAGCTAVSAGGPEQLCSRPQTHDTCSVFMSKADQREGKMQLATMEEMRKQTRIDEWTRDESGLYRGCGDGSKAEPQVTSTGKEGSTAERQKIEKRNLKDLELELRKGLESQADDENQSTFRVRKV